ncbi:MAG: GAF domain-containing protein [Planctomycetia bacterium]|nr:GAF domain-containing protein [Planctomycetia bacterium]
MLDSDFYDKQLKTFPALDSTPDREDVPFFGSFPDLFRAFRQTTGYHLQFVRTGGSLPRTLNGEQGKDGNPLAQGGLLSLPVEGPTRRTLGNILVWKDQEATAHQEAEVVAALAKSLATVLSELYLWSGIARQRETELAVCSVRNGAPYSVDRTLADRIYSALKQGAQVVGCQAAAIYLLDEATSCLKVRCVWGLPEERLADAPRPLKGALADLEAMLGNAVILNENYLTDLWKAPETFNAALCLPLTASTSVLGTLWLYSDEKTKFTDHDLAILEILADRLALELELAAQTPRS